MSRHSIFSLFASPLLLAAWTGASPTDSLSVEVPPGDTARISFTVLHTHSHNWLQTQIEPISACQKLVVDSTKVFDTSRLDTSSSKQVVLNSVPHRDVRVWWHLAQEPMANHCLFIKASRRMDLLPDPKVRGGTYQNPVSWVVGVIDARGPGNRNSPSIPLVVDQAQDLEGGICPDYSIVCFREVYDSESVARRTLLEKLRNQVGNGLPVVRVGNGQVFGEMASLSDTNAIRSLGALSFWSAGNLVSFEIQKLNTVRSWGPKTPLLWTKPTGRRFYEWKTTTGLCCENCDSLCDLGPETWGISASGPNVVVTNDSARDCGWPSKIDGNLNNDLANDWLILPDSAEWRTGTLIQTLSELGCGNRSRSWRIFGDSLEVGNVRVPMSALEAISGVLPKSNLARTVWIQPTSRGITIHTNQSVGETWSVRIHDLSGRVLSSANFADPEASLVLREHGTFLVELVDAIGNASHRTIVR